MSESAQERTRVGVTGGRDYADSIKVWDALTNVYEEFGPLTVVNGKCPTGADAHATLWVVWAKAEGMNVEEDAYPAEWSRHGRAAGVIRNSEMVQSGLDLLCAFPGGRGTNDMTTKARKADVVTRFIGGK